MSTFQFTGYVGREPEVKNVNGSKLLSVSVAYSTGKDDPTLWVDVACWGPMGERLAGTIKKKDLVFCSASVRQISAYIKKNGEVGQSMRATGHYIKVLEKPNTASHHTGSSSGSDWSSNNKSENSWGSNGGGSNGEGSNWGAKQDKDEIPF